MKTISLYSCLLTSLFLGACSKETPATEQIRSTTTATLVGSTASETRMPTDMVDELYSDLTAQNEALADLEKEMAKLRREQAEATQPYMLYNGKSKQYYNDALNLSSAIDDSLLKNSVEVLIKKSEHLFLKRSLKQDQHLAKLTQAYAEVEDNYKALKIILTLDLIEKYQQQKAPATASYQGLIERLQQSIKHIDGLKEAK